MATRNGRSAEDVRQDIESERERLATAVEDLRTGIGEATDIRRMLQGKVPVGVVNREVLAKWRGNVPVSP